MGKSDTLTRPVLGSRAAKQVENPLVVLGVDAAPVVGDFENGKAQLLPPAHGDVPTTSWDQAKAAVDPPAGAGWREFRSATSPFNSAPSTPSAT